MVVLTDEESDIKRVNGVEFTKSSKESDNGSISGTDLGENKIGLTEIEENETVAQSEERNSNITLSEEDLRNDSLEVSGFAEVEKVFDNRFVSDDSNTPSKTITVYDKVYANIELSDKDAIAPEESGDYISNNNLVKN